jgi:hypothetical protein
MYGPPPLTDYERAALSVTAKAAEQGRVVKFGKRGTTTITANFTSQGMNKLQETLERYANDTRKLEDIETLGMF